MIDNFLLFIAFYSIAYVRKSNAEFTMIKAGLKAGIVLFGIALSGCMTEQVKNAPHNPNLKVCPVEYVEDHVNTYSLTRDWKLIGFLGTTSLQITSPPCIPHSSKHTEMI